VHQELADGIQNGLLIKVQTALVEGALMTTVIRDSKPTSEETCVAALKQEPAPRAIEETAMPECSRENTPRELCLQAIVKAGLSTSLPEHEKKSCAWALQLQKDVARLLGMHVL
jgi:hypothetical protein